jgi:ubiquinone/menaquinone biosynthesis C-methylase UbiE
MKVTGFQDTIAWYNNNAKQYAQAVSEHGSIKDINQFAKLLPKKATILDAGCAAGRDTNRLSQKGLQVTGLDLSSGLITLARKTFPTITFIEGNMLSLPFPDNTFDGVWACASLLHLETVADVTKALREFHRVMKQNGIVYVSVKTQIGDAKTEVVNDSLSQHDRFFQFELISLEQRKGTHKRIPEVEWISAFAYRK